jgi:hypothetical protein
MRSWIDKHEWRGTRDSWGNDSSCFFRGGRRNLLTFRLNLGRWAPLASSFGRPVMKRDSCGGTQCTADSAIQTGRTADDRSYDRLELRARLAIPAVVFVIYRTSTVPVYCL